jgi:hypothetical protein
VATKEITKTLVRSDSDSAWKDILDYYLKDFLDYCLTELSEQIDWNKGWTSLDKELQSITKDNLTGKRLVDKLIKVSLKTGKDQWLLIHIEVQGNPDSLFPERMFTYSYRLYDKYKQPLYCCAILTDDRVDWRPNHHEISLADFKLRVDYHVVKLLDYRAEKEKLENDMNPFASVILVQLAAVETKNKSDQVRLNIKLALTKRLYKKGFTKEQIQKLYLFIDWLINLPEPLEAEYLKEIYELEESQAMSYISNAERFGIEKGIIKGRLEGQMAGRIEGESVLLAKLLQCKFGLVSPAIQQRIKTADTDTLLHWGERLIKAETIAEVFQDSI